MQCEISFLVGQNEIKTDSQILRSMENVFTCRHTVTVKMDLITVIVEERARVSIEFEQSCTNDDTSSIVEITYERCLVRVAFKVTLDRFGKCISLPDV